MIPYINIFGRIIPTYGIIAFIGISVAILFAIFYFAKYYDIKKEDALYCSIFAVIGAGIGAKLLYIITVLPDLIRNFSTIDWETAIPILLQGGFVFYGGLIGGILGVLIYAKMYKLSLKSLLVVFCAAMPLFHAIGRLACLCAGCCYGMEYHGFGNIVFHDTVYAPVGIPLFPTQIVESICNLIIFIVILLTFKKFKGTYKTVALYVVMYSVVRFALEFCRGDLERGILLGLSTSQWISMILFIAGIGLFIYSSKHKEKEVNSN